VLTQILTAAGLLALAGPAAADECRLALVLALDVSASMSADEDRLQREGLAIALMKPQIADAFLSDAPVALFVFQWSGVSAQASILPDWILVRSEEDLAYVAAAIAGSQKTHANYLDRATALGTALAYAALALQQGPDCSAKAIDVSSDGANNAGIGPEAVYQTFPFEDVTVNALITSRGLRNSVRLVSWYEAHALHGPGAFHVLADGYEDYARAMQAKLRRELEVPVADVGPEFVPANPAEPQLHRIAAALSP
jgi:hypothetical protein